MKTSQDMPHIWMSHVKHNESASQHSHQKILKWDNIYSRLTSTREYHYAWKGVELSMNYVTYIRSHVTHINESRNTYECVTSHESSYQWIVSNIEWVMSHVWMSRVTHTNESRRTYECVTSHMWMGPVTYVSESWHTYKCVMAHIWMRDVTHMNASCHIYDES